MELRPYQIQAKHAAYKYLAQHPGQCPLVVMPTGSGKTPLISSICMDAARKGRRALVLAHRKEVLVQTADKLRTMAPELPFGVYSAGLKRREADAGVLLAQIQSVHQRATELGVFNIVIVDEAHLIQPRDDGMYRRLLTGLWEINPSLRLAGLTATPYRTTTGSICGPEGIFDEIAYEAGVQDLTDQGYLSPLTTRVAVHEADTTNLHVRAGEFIAAESEALMGAAAIVQTACKEIVAATRDRKSVLVFSVGVKHGQHVRDTIRQLGCRCEFVCGTTPDAERDRLLNDFKAGSLQFLVNCDLLTVGFDHPGVDCVAVLRPTMSAGLWAQMVGRGLRRCEGKTDCLVLDFGGNGLRHGPITAIRVPEGRRGGKGSGAEAPGKMCPGCRAIVAAGCTACPDCGHEFPVRKRTMHSAYANQDAGEETLVVTRVTYCAARKSERCTRASKDHGRHVRHSRWTGHQRVDCVRAFQMAAMASMPVVAGTLRRKCAKVS